MWVFGPYMLIWCLILNSNDFKIDIPIKRFLYDSIGIYISCTLCTLSLVILSGCVRNWCRKFMFCRSCAYLQWYKIGDPYILFLLWLQLSQSVWCVKFWLEIHSIILLVLWANIITWYYFYSIMNLFGVLKFKRMGEDFLRNSGLPFTIIRYMV